MSKELILALGAPPKLGAKQEGLGRAATSKAYKGSMLPDTQQDDDEDAFQGDGPPRDDTHDDMLVGAAQDVLAAFHDSSRDPAAVAEALESFVQMCR